MDVCAQSRPGIALALGWCRDLDFSDNQLAGKLPTFLTAFTALTNLDLSNNRLAGPAPTSLSTWFTTTQHKYVHMAWMHSRALANLCAMWLMGEG